MKKILLAAMCGIALAACNDDLEQYTRTELVETRIVQAANISSTSGLVQEVQMNGDHETSNITWRATRRVPLVGAGRVINSQDNALVGVGVDNCNADYVTNLNLCDYATPQAIVADAGVAYTPIVAVRDINYVYSGNQKAGFVCMMENKSSVLTLDVLKGFSLTSFLRGEKQEGIVYTQATNVLDLGLGNISTGDGDNTLCIEGTFTKPFDEIRLNINGVNAGVVSGSIRIYYAYVGENTMIPAVNNYEPSNGYFNSGCSATAYGVNNNALVDNNLDNGYVMAVLNVATPIHVDFGREVPAGAEVGFYSTFLKVLGLDVAGTVVVKTDYDGVEQESTTFTKIVGLGLVGGGGTYHSITTTKPCTGVSILFAGVSVNLGGTMVHYAYVREPTYIDPSSYFTLSNMVVYNSGFRFAPPTFPGSTVTYEIIRQPAGANATIEDYLIPNGLNATIPDGSQYIWNMNVPGNYTVKATFTYTDANGNECTTEQVATITRAVKTATCNTPLVNLSNETVDHIYEATAGGGWRVITVDIVDTGRGVDNLVDPDTDNFYEHIGGLKIELIRNEKLVGVRRIDGNTINPGEEKVRVGFVVAYNKDFLSAGVLNFLRVRLKKNGTVVDKGVADGSVSVSLINGSSESDTGEDGQKNNRIRLFIESSEDFDEVELYSTGVAEIDLASNMQIYHAFCERADDCINFGEECMQLICNANYHAEATAEVNGLAAVGRYVKNLGNMVDGSFSSYATIVQAVDAATGSFVNVKFDPIPGYQELGFIFKTDVDIVNLIGVVQIKAFYDGTEVASSTSGGALDVKLVQAGPNVYLSIVPNAPLVDQLQYIVGKGVNLGGGLNIFGVYFRPDLNNDGLMDCITDRGRSTGWIDLYVIDEHICEGGSTLIQMDGGFSDMTYILEFNDVNNAYSVAKSVNVKVASYGYLANADDPTVDICKDLPAGQYTLTLRKRPQDINVDAGDREDGVIISMFNHVDVHPLKTTWRGTVSTDWNEWGNWDNGTPWTCTDVVIPSHDHMRQMRTAIGTATKGYPRILASNQGVGYCNNLHIEYGASLHGQHRLKHSGVVYADLELKGGYYNLVSAPLQGMYTGDMFTPSTSWPIGGSTPGAWNADGKWNSYDNYFEPLTPANYVEERISPLFFQRYWASIVENRTLTRTEEDTWQTSNADMNFTDWSRTFNAVNTAYIVSTGFAVRPGNVKGATYTLHFPKSHATYNYYDRGGKAVGVSDNITRYGYGKMMIDDCPVPSQLNLSRIDEGQWYLFGNPFFAYISVKKLLEHNAGHIEAIYRYQSPGYVQVTAEDDYAIRPWEAVFIKLAGDLHDEDFSYHPIVISANNDFDGDNVFYFIDNAETPPVIETPYHNAGLVIEATANGQTTYAAVTRSASATDDFKAREDAPLLVGGEQQTRAVVYTVGGGRALCSQRMQAATSIPVGLWMQDTSEVTLTFRAHSSEWDEWQLLDTQTGRRYDLFAPITFTDMQSGSDRLKLVKQ